MNWDAALEMWARVMFRASWQGGLAVVLAWGVATVLGRVPRVGSWVWRGGYMKFLACLILVAPVSVALLPAVGGGEGEKGRTGDMERGRRGEKVSGGEMAHVVEGGADFMVREAPLVPGAAGVAAPVATPQAAAEAGVVVATHSAGAVSAGAEHAGGMRALRVGLFVLWVAGVVIYFWNVGRAYWRTVGLRGSARESDDAGMRAVCGEIGARMGVRRVPEILVVDSGEGPLLTGVFRPVIILPAGLMERCGAGKLRLVLAHELAHLKRRDLAWNAFHAVVEGLFFFHPVLWLARRRVRLSQELACDQMALAATGVTAAAYGMTLLDVLTHQHVRRGALVGVGVASSAEGLKRRLVAMKTMTSWTARRLAAAGMMGAVVAVTGLVPWRVVAQSTPAAPATTAAQPSATKPAEAGYYTPAQIALVSGEMRDLLEARKIAKDRANAASDLLLDYQKKNGDYGRNERTDAVAQANNVVEAIDGRIVQMAASWKPTAAQMGVLAEQAKSVAPISDLTSSSIGVAERATSAGEGGAGGPRRTEVMTQRITIKYAMPTGAAGVRDDLVRMHAAGAGTNVTVEVAGETLTLKGSPADVRRIAEIVSMWEFESAQGRNNAAERATGFGPAVGRGEPGSTTAPPRITPEDMPPLVLEVTGMLSVPVVEIKTALDGKLAEIVAKEGQAVKRGDALFKLDERGARAAMQMAEIKLEGAEQKTSGAAVGVRSATERVEAENQVRLAKVELEMTRNALEDLTIRAPMDGVVQTYDLVPGQLVSRGTFLTKIAGTGELRVSMYIPNYYAGDIHVGQPFTVRVEGEAPATAEVTYIGSIAEAPDQRLMVMMRGNVVSGARLGHYKSGMTVNVYITPQVHKP